MVSFLVSTIIGKRCGNQSLCSYLSELSLADLKIMRTVKSVAPVNTVSTGQPDPEGTDLELW